MQGIIASRASQYNHDIKRKEREHNRVKERLNQLLIAKKENKQGNMFYLNKIFLDLLAYKRSSYY